MSINQAIARVMNSQAFSNKEVLKGLLKFLADAFNNGQKVKEADIAIDYFKRAGFVPGEDTIVRVNMHKLRALLEKYYLEEGKSDLAVIEIPKGHYTISIKEKDHPVVAVNEKPVRFPGWLMAVLLILSLLANAYLLVKPETKHSDTGNKHAENPFWAGYVESGKPVYVIMGDPFFFHVKSHNGTTDLIVRDTNINSAEELQNERLEWIPKGEKPVRLDFPYFSRNNIWALPDILSVFAKADVDTRLQALSESNIGDVKNNNVVFIASIDSFGFMNKFLEKTSIRLSTNPKKITISNAEKQLVLRTPERINGSYEDYAFLVKLPGPNHNVITMMGDFHASAMKGLSSYISQPASLKRIQKEVTDKYGHFPAYFEMVVKVTSYSYADFETSLIYFREL